MGYHAKSSKQNKEPVKALLQEFRSEGILELGAGAGDFGWLIQKYRPGARLFGVEIWGPNFQSLPLSCYRGIFHQDIREFPYEQFIPAFKVDTVLAIDVLEHLPRGESVALLGRLEQMHVNIIISVPIVRLEQEAIDGNEYERHVDHWRIEDMAAFGYKLHFRGRLVGVFFKRGSR